MGDVSPQVSDDRIPVIQTQLPQWKWRSIELSPKPDNAMHLPQDQLELLRKLRKLPNADGDVISVCDLQVGDVVFVQEFNAVAFSQKITQVFSQKMAKTGRSNSVHCMIVVANNGVTTKVAHVTRDGGVVHYIEDPLRISEFERNGLEAPESGSMRGFNGTVYRLESSREIREKAAEVAMELVEGFRISYATSNAIGSVLKNPRAGNYLGAESRQGVLIPNVPIGVKQGVASTLSQVPPEDEESDLRFLLNACFPCFAKAKEEEKDIRSEPLIELNDNSSGRTIDAKKKFGKRLTRLDELDRKAFEEQSREQKEQEASGAPIKLCLFCSEFIIKCYQEALAHIDRLLEQKEVRIIDLRGDACSPMAFEGFLAENAKLYHDWKSCGKLYAEFNN
jgi:hypothetical protein